MIQTDLQSGRLHGPGIVTVRKTVGDLRGFWEDDAAAASLSETLLYETETFLPHPDGTLGAVLWGNTILQPGQVGRERFMTRGHWHTLRDRGELVIGVSGEGLVLLMDEARIQHEVRLEPGVTFHIDGCFAHRTVNVGTVPLVFLCAWPADCGHEYDAIREQGFAHRIYT